MEGGQGPQAVGRQELALVEQLGEQPGEVDPDHAEEHPPIAGFAVDQALLGQAPGTAHSRSSRANAFPTVSARPIASSSMTTAASSGMTPTIDRTLTGTARPSGPTSLS